MKKAILSLLCLLASHQAWSDGNIYLPNLSKSATGTTNSSHPSLDVNVTGGTLSLSESATEANGGSGLPALIKIIGGYDGSNVRVIKTDTAGIVESWSNSGTAGSGSSAGATVSTVITLTKPSNAIGFILMNIDTSTANIRWAVGRTATTTLGQQLQPGRDTPFVPANANVSLVAESGTQTYDIQWIAR